MELKRTCANAPPRMSVLPGCLPVQGLENPPGLRFPSFQTPIENLVHCDSEPANARLAVSFVWLQSDAFQTAHVPMLPLGWIGVKFSPFGWVSELRTSRT